MEQQRMTIGQWRMLEPIQTQEAASETPPRSRAGYDSRSAALRSPCEGTALAYTRAKPSLSGKCPDLKAEVLGRELRLFNVKVAG